MVTGIIYMYTSPSGKSYIGQTYKEELRRKLWRSARYHYAGDKIDRARAKYGRDAFQYKILFSKVFASEEIAMLWLNIAEKYFIQLYDTVNNGYNCEYGGGGNADHTGAINHHHGGYTLSEEARRNIGEASRKRQNTPEGRTKMSSVRKGITKKRGYRIELKFKPIVQLSLDGDFIQEFPSVRDAGEFLGIENCRVNIGNVCNGKRETACGYRWLFKDDYYTFFLNPEANNIPQRVLKQLNSVRLRVSKDISRPHFCKRIAQFDLAGNKLREFDSIKEASNYLGKPHASISQCLSGRRKTAYGYKWEYI